MVPPVSRRVRPGPGEQARHGGHPSVPGLPARTSGGRDASGQGEVTVPRSRPRAPSAGRSSVGESPAPWARAERPLCGPADGEPAARTSTLPTGAGVSRSPAHARRLPALCRGHASDLGVVFLRLGGGTPLRFRWNQPFPRFSLHPRTGAGTRPAGTCPSSGRPGTDRATDASGRRTVGHPLPHVCGRAPPRLWAASTLTLGGTGLGNIPIWPPGQRH